MEYSHTVRGLPRQSALISDILFRARIHTFSASSLLTMSRPLNGGPGPAITALGQSPAIDVIGLGFATGEISVYDVRMDERLMKMSIQDGAVRALSFRTGTSDMLFRIIFLHSVCFRWPTRTGLWLVYRPHYVLGSEQWWKAPSCYSWST